MHSSKGNKDSNRESTGSSSSMSYSEQKQIMLQKPNDAWEKRWARGVTPWDLGRPTPILQHLLQNGDLPKGTALIPGCGRGYDVAAIASPERFVVGLDLSETCIKLANEMHSKSPNAENFAFVKGDFFTWRPTTLFDLIFDYTFFCAIEPYMRDLWGKKMSKLLKPGGLLITLMLYTKNDRNDRPPYKAVFLDYETVLKACGFELVYLMNNEQAVGDRKGNEKLALWKLSKGFTKKIN